jgi:ribosomal protein S18 acetylase RimI-like enzyme
MNKSTTLPNTTELSLLLSQAFAKDPWIRKLFSDNADKAQHFFEFVIHYCINTGGQVLIEYQDFKLAAVACLENPTNKVSFFGTIKLIKALVSFLTKCGLKSLRIINTYMRLTTRSRPKEKHHYLICIGVAPEFMNRGIGKKMLSTLHTIVDEDSSSIGIGLDTENPNNIAFYEHFSYRLTGTEHLDELRIYTMFRPSKRTLHQEI